MKNLSGAEHTSLLSFIPKLIVIPRQARDKHRESTQKREMCAFFAAGPTIAGCKYDKAGAAIEVSLDAERLGGEGVAVQPFDTNVAGECVRESRLYFSTPVFLLLNLPFLSFPFLS